MYQEDACNGILIKHTGGREPFSPKDNFFASLVFYANFLLIIINFFKPLRVSLCRWQKHSQQLPEGNASHDSRNSEYFKW